MDSILDSWILFTICCLALWAPGWPLLALRRIQSLKKVKRNAPWKTSLTYAPNWSDFLRSGSVTFILVTWARAYASTHPENTMTATAATFACMAVGTLIQCQVTRHGRFMVLPTFYVMGISLFVAGWEIGLFTVGCTLTAGFNIPNRNGLLPFLALALVVSGLLVGAPVIQMATGTLIALIPFSLFVLTGKTGIQPSSYTFDEAF